MFIKVKGYEDEKNSGSYLQHDGEIQNRDSSGAEEVKELAFWQEIA